MADDDIGIVPFLVDMNLLDNEIENGQNQITIFNFMNQAKERNIIQLTERTCKGEYSGFFSKYDAFSSLTLAYDTLFTHLVKNHVIKREVKLASVITWNHVYTIDHNLIKLSNLERILQNDNLPPSLKCYNIDCKKLHEFLSTYKYSRGAMIKFINKGRKSTGGGTPKRKIVKTRKVSTRKTRSIR